MKELVVISGKGGTGKTSIVGAFATLSERAVLADCDVDAPDLAIVMSPFVLRREPFSGGSQARIRTKMCAGCGTCMDVCRFGAISNDGPGNEIVKKTFRVDPIACEGCGVCNRFCPTGALIFSPAINGEWFISSTRVGPMVHAKLGIAQENSGKLINLVRTHARRIAVEEGRSLILVDGPPGIGCPVIASVTGSDLVLVVTEPTLSGLHDFSRVADLTEHFGIQTLLLINKWDLNNELTSKLEVLAQRRNVRLVGRVSFDKAITQAQIRKQSIIEYQSDGVAGEIRQAWTEVSRVIDQQESSVIERHSSSTLYSNYPKPHKGGLPSRS
jgi:MinD superfamily P-loop ATPase